ncbi:hypothetical protein SERLA73DRAFT_173948 [Serpula lacrymans var. lacrymans S7.3]|uniref:Eukaryotic translation initiation factor 3 subunit B n=2 Tax=Serpula lacrymans var. lacrymans TaxID=341189 RepID=F8PFX1_SERL3|nr:uncharacterized protein SERLADRAFT_454915 [Serpula lacrymans var. lacrymans S7.9]EGO04783.1 hypothetical protein SERLA73DRAFT_173948 [Serpula lacrymans var. lacrymans S7.3]EGO30620.1 hypothetical protein SERLADRAFT_454915 [Serpula lacrymans var. lacrymans S7.9]
MAELHHAPRYTEDLDFSDILTKYQIQHDDGFDNIVVVDGVPVIDNSKLDKLLSKITKEFSKKGIYIKQDEIHVPWDKCVGKSKGFIFINLRNAEDTSLSLTAMHGHAFDARHQFKINRFVDVERYVQLNETYLDPPMEDYHTKEHLRSWLADPLGRDQYVTYRGEDVEIRWHGKSSQSGVSYSKKAWTELYVSWSPQGTYLATIYRQGVRLWGGPSWEHQQRFAHPLVKLIDFSPCEQYLVTWSHDPINVPANLPQGPEFFSPEDEGNHIAVWDVKTGHLLRTFPSASLVFDDSLKKQMQWPALKWSADDKFVARITPGQHISVYELPTMGLHGKKSLKIESVVDFEWCPHGDKDKDEGRFQGSKGRKLEENMLAYWTPEVANQPARVTLLTFPGRTILRQKNLFNVTECKLFWQNHGDFLCVKVDRHTKTKKSTFCNLEIFRVREKDFPVEVVELKDTVNDFAWEPRGERFAIITSADSNLGSSNAGTVKTDISFYQLDPVKNDFKLLRVLPSRTSNTIRWSPRGRHIVLATVGSSTKSELEFWDMDFFSEERREGQAAKEDWAGGIQHLGSADHYGVTDVEWDPSGRFLATSASAWRHTLENGYAIWDFRGQEIEKHLVDRFKQLIWRPRPHSLLTQEQKREVRRKLREYGRSFDEEDAAEESSISAELVGHRKRLVDEWNTWRARCRQEVAEEQHSRIRLALCREESKEEIEEWIDEVIDQTEEVVD